MAWSISDLFPTWGDSGEQPAENFQYDGEDQVNEKHFDYLWDSLYTLEDQIRSALTDIDSDADGTVDEADSALLYKDNDIDSDGDGIVDEADYANDADASTYKGNDLDGDGDGVVDEADDTTTVKGNDIDSDGDGKVDAADNADQYDGVSPSDGSNGDVYQTDGTSGSFGPTPSPPSTIANPFHGDQSDGSITVSSNTTEDELINATEYTVENGVTVTPSGRSLIIKASEKITIDGTIDGTGAIPGGSAAQNGSPGFFYPQQGGGGGGQGQNGGNMPDGGDGGDGDTTQTPKRATVAHSWNEHYFYEAVSVGAGASGGGGADGEGSNSNNNSTGGESGSFPGGAGSGGFNEGGTENAPGGPGGGGGALIVLMAPTIEVSGSILAAGEDGTDGTVDGSVSSGAGGGGSGGTIFIAANDLTENTPTYDVSKGVGGTAPAATYQGGDGADGVAGEVYKFTA